MKDFVLTNRYNATIPFTWDKENKCYFMSTANVAYVSEHMYTDSSDIFGIDPEGLFIIAVGSKLTEENKEISFIERTNGGYNLYLK